MWETEAPYSQAERQEMRRLIVASGIALGDWVLRTRRSAEFVRSLSPEQADIITAQALAVESEPDDLGTAEELASAEALFVGVAPEERHKHLWWLLIEIRRRHYPASR